MGACNFEVQQQETTMSKAYSGAVEDAIHDCGNDSYNGTISTTSGFKDYTRKFKNSTLDINAFTNKYLDDANKWGDCIGVCIKEPRGNKNKVKSKVENIVTKGAKKWETVFVVTDRHDNEVGHAPKKGDAIKLARHYTEETQRRTFIEIEKRLVGSGSGSDSIVAKITYKADKKESLGTYVFFGWAAE